MKHVILFGPPAAGKGTQANNIAGKTGMSPTSTGDILRAAAKAGTKIGKRADKIMKVGGLVDDTIIVDIIADYLSNKQIIQGVLFDGFPRTVKQAESLDDLIIKRKEELAVVINIIVPDRILFSRVENRLKQTHPNQRRADDTPDALKVRLENYRLQTLPVLKYYEKLGKVQKINGNGSINEVTNNILRVLEEIGIPI